MKKTPLSDYHAEHGGRMVEFAGWEMPVQFKGLREEYAAVRERVGLFDVSHMGEIWLRGPHALETAEWLTTNSVAKLEEGQAQYTLMTNHRGGIVDDLIVYCGQKETEYLLCVNAANIAKDDEWIRENNRGAQISNESTRWGQIAIQGPRALDLVKRLWPEQDWKGTPSFGFRSFIERDQQIIVARTGYTGEDGFEAFIPWDHTKQIWVELLEKGQDLDVQPAGLAVRDVLRTEMGLCLYGQDITDEHNPYEARLGWVVKPDGKDFIGRDALLAVKEKGVSRKLMGFRLQERGVPRAGYTLFSFDNEEIGKVTSGTMSLKENAPVGLGYIAAPHAIVGETILVDVRGRRLKAEIVKPPFLQRKKK